MRNISEDGVIREILPQDGKIRLTVGFPRLSGYLEERCREEPERIVFSARSRIARLGIEVLPQSPLRWDGGEWSLDAEAFSIIPGYPCYQNLARVLFAGLKVARLFYADPERRLSSEAIYALFKAGKVKLPQGFSLREDGQVSIPCHRKVYTFEGGLALQDVRNILTGVTGRIQLDRMQKATEVDDIVIPPGQGVVTSFSLFLAGHFAVIDDRDIGFGRHSRSVVLDPVITRGQRIIFEIYNPTSSTIVNPLMSLSLYATSPADVGVTVVEEGLGRALLDHAAVARAYEGMARSVRGRNCWYVEKPAAWVGSLEDLDRLSRGDHEWVAANGPESGRCPQNEQECAEGRHDFSPDSLCPHVYSVHHLGGRLGGCDPRTPPGRQGALILNYFPNLAEHRLIMRNEILSRIDTILFRHPSMEHGIFLSDHDHARLREYEASGVRVLWLNDTRREVARHVFRRGMGFFMRPDVEDRFRKAILFSFYGSTAEIPPEDETRLKDLVTRLSDFFGGEIGVLTGGGSGVMEFINRVANEGGLLSGASHLEITDQRPNPHTDFYQFFQESSRHNRQKWFEISDFPVFCLGGIGTLEEVGVTFCNLKLDVMEEVPLIFFGSVPVNGVREPYWRPLQGMLETMARCGRAPDWVRRGVLVTDSPEEVIDFYRSSLKLA